LLPPIPPKGRLRLPLLDLPLQIRGLLLELPQHNDGSRALPKHSREPLLGLLHPLHSRQRTSRRAHHMVPKRRALRSQST
jgi:hypothetical protein